MWNFLPKKSFWLKTQGWSDSVQARNGFWYRTASCFWQSILAWESSSREQRGAGAGGSLPPPWGWPHTSQLPWKGVEVFSLHVVLFLGGGKAILGNSKMFLWLFLSPLQLVGLMVIKAFGLTSGRIMKTVSVISRSAATYSQNRNFLRVCVFFRFLFLQMNDTTLKHTICHLLGCCDPAPENEKHNSAFPEH